MASEDLYGQYLAWIKTLGSEGYEISWRLKPNFNKANFTKEKDFEVIEKLWTKEVYSSSALHSWASRITDMNTASRLHVAARTYPKGYLPYEYRDSWLMQSIRVRKDPTAIKFITNLTEAIEALFWEITGKSDRVKPEAPPPKAKPTWNPPEIPPNLVPMTADGWELYSSQPGSGQAAKALGRAMTTALGMVGRNVTPYNKDEKNTAILAKIIARFGKALETQADFGAGDTEPESRAIDVFEAYLKKYLDRWDFEKTWRALDRGNLGRYASLAGRWINRHASS